MISENSFIELNPSWHPNPAAMRAPPFNLLDGWKIDRPDRVVDSSWEDEDGRVCNLYGLIHEDRPITQDCVYIICRKELSLHVMKVYVRDGRPNGGIRIPPGTLDIEFHDTDMGDGKRFAISQTAGIFYNEDVTKEDKSDWFSRQFYLFFPCTVYKDEYYE